MKLDLDAQCSIGAWRGTLSQGVIAGLVTPAMLDALERPRELDRDDEPSPRPLSAIDRAVLEHALRKQKARASQTRRGRL